MPKRGPRNRYRGNTRSSQLILGFNKLKGWAELGQDPDELLLEIIMSLKELKGLLSQTLNKDKLQLLTDILDTALKAKHHEQCFGHFLETLMTAKFFTADFTIYLNSNARLFTHKLANTALIYIKEASVRIPDKMEHCNQLVVFLCENYYSLNCDAESVTKMRDIFQARLKKKPTFLISAQPRKIDLEDFGNIPTLPTHMDLKPDCTPLLGEIKVNGPYRDRHEYLDIMYRLMREDMVQPLREALRQVKDGDHSNVILFENIKIVGVEIKDGIVHLLKLDISRLRDFKSMIKNNFLTGNLVCLSYDNFHSILFATYANNTVQELSNGIVKLNFINCLYDVFSLPSNACLKLIESPSFYEAYSHVLEGLKSWRDVPLPLESYLVACKRNPDKPKYLSQGTVYDISCLMRGEACHATPCKVLSTESWPFLHKASLNAKQLEAVKEALTKELTLIQGPPGTGKTFVSLKIMRTLLENLSAQSPDHGPILVVCYTNHALDQFLEGILKFCNEGIIRVGGNSKCEALESYNIAEVRKYDKARFKYLNRALYNIYRQMEPLEKRIKKLIDKLNLANRKVLDERVLGDFMIEYHQQCFFGNVTKSSSGSIMNEWLKMKKTDFESYLKEAAEARAISLILQERSMRNDTCLDFTKYIPLANKAMVYRMWLNKYGEKFGRFEENAILSDKQLKPIVADIIFSRIYSLGYSNVKSWVLGRNLEEIISTIEYLQNKKVDLPQESFGDSEYDSDETISTVSSDSDVDMDTRSFDYDMDRLENSSVAMSLLKRMASLGIHMTKVKDLDCTSRGQISYGEALRRIETSPLASSEEESKIINLWTLDITARFRLYKSWRNRYIITLSEQIIALHQKYLDLVEAKNELHRMRDISILRNAKVVGMTTTGAAKHRKLLEAVGPRIVVVEEAAEVQEAHIITALSRKCQHLILIGDHKQLRPKVQVYELAQHYHLDVSLFERLVENNFKCIQLDEQFRMRPEISIFMRHIYPDLKDGESVKSRPGIAGMDKCAFFIKHNKSEQKMKQGTSKLNTFEGKYLLKLSEYLLSQGHEASHITILAAYGGQVTSIQDLLSTSRNSALKDIRVSTIDNFQGEENRIILLSLVRSNSDNQVGFLSTDNRVCVALSRAQFGMYVIGDIDLLSRRSQLWRNIKTTAEKENCIGHILRLSCQQHNRVTEIVKVTDFDQAIQTKGCGLPCKTELSCGHLCPQMCHIGNHDNYVCRANCLKLCPRGHGCSKRCNEPCPPCNTILSYKLSCGHIQKQPCSVDTATLVCREKCKKMCPKGHLCSEDCKIKCPPCGTLVERQLSCGHMLLAPCHKKKVECVEQCQKRCSRGHRCLLLCKETCKPCSKYVSVTLSCGHTLLEQCWKYTSGLTKCVEPCPLICPRGHKCPKLCQEACSPCSKKLPCGHQCLIRPQLVDMDSAEDIPCFAECFNICRNGHLCPKKCGVECPPYCSMILKCGHMCKRNLDNPVLYTWAPKDVCDESCNKMCERGHNCFSNCSEPCLPCGEMLTCGHRCASIPNPHTEPDPSKPCPRQCTKVCSRGHQCPAKCHEICPPYCSHLKCKIIKVFSSKKTGFQYSNEWRNKEWINK